VNGNSKFSLFIQGSSIQFAIYCLPLIRALNSDIQIDLDIIEIVKSKKYGNIESLIQRREVSFPLKLANKKNIQNLLMNIDKIFFFFKKNIHFSYY